MRKLLARHGQFLVFVSGGALCAVLDIGLMQLLLAGGAGVLWAASAGFLAGLLLNYAFHARLTFRRAQSGATFLRFIAVVALNYLITLACIEAALLLHAGALAGKLASLPLVAVNGFLLSKHWIFKTP